MKRFVIQNVETDMFVKHLYIARDEFCRFVRWSPLIEEAVLFENEEEAEATITFIGAVIDWELEELLTVISE